MRSRLDICIVLTLLATSACGQVNKKILEYDRTFQVSIFPGISTPTCAALVIGAIAQAFRVGGSCAVYVWV